MPKITALPPHSTPSGDDVLPVVDSDDVTTKKITVKDLGSFSMPVGATLDFAGATAPSGWLMCYGQAVSRATYSDLFAAIGTLYGAGNGSSTFNIPDARGRVIAGKDNMGGSSANRLTGQAGGVNGDTLAASGGDETHTLSTAQIPSHTHTESGHTNFGVGPGANGAGASANTSTGSTGGGGAHNNVQPVLIMQKIIRY